MQDALIGRLHTVAADIADILTRLGGTHRPLPLTSQDRRQLREDAQRSLADLTALCGDFDAWRGSPSIPADPSARRDPGDPVEPGGGLDAVLAAVRRTDDAVEAGRAALQQAVEEARTVGASWRRIGETLGITAQSAHKRFDPAARRRHADSMRRHYQRLRTP